MSRILGRADFDGSSPAAPVRHVHLGLGAFHRAHQLAYTDISDLQSEWGVASFTGRRPDVARILSAQDGLYTLVERGPHTDELRTIRALSQAHDGSDVLQLAKLVASRDVRIVTLTITEAGYCLGPDGALDLGAAAVVHDLQALGTLRGCVESVFLGRVQDLGLSTAIARLVAGLEARRRAHGEPISVVPCDNLPANGYLLSSIVEDFGRVIGDEFVSWVRECVDFVSTSVDRITPATTDSDLADVEAVTGYVDRAVVVTETFTDWVLSGSFRGGRPQWETAGALFVNEIEPFENRKLWMLNGAHTFLANAGRLLGYETVAQAIEDEALIDATRGLWNEAEACLPSGDLGLADYRAALLGRFGNARIEHKLEQIAADTTMKLAVRVAPVALSQLSAGRTATASARVFGAWIAALDMPGSVRDSRSVEIDATRSAVADRPRSLVRMVSDELAARDGFMSDVTQFARQYQAQSTAPRRRNQ